MKGDRILKVQRHRRTHIVTYTDCRMSETFFVRIESSMAEKNNLTFVQEEELCELVHNFPILYDKSHKGYKERDAVANAWEESLSQIHR